MRLIDADNYCKNLCKCNSTECDKAKCPILNAPVAYDPDKVVKQLEEERELSYADFDRYVEEVSPCLDDEYDDFFHRGLERAIRIVKGGGVDE